MFDLITGHVARPLRKRSPVSTILALLAHAAIVVTVVVIPLLTATNVLPEVPTIMAFVAVPPPPPPPPPPRAGASVPVKPTTSAGAAPVEAPSAIEPERPSASPNALAGVEGGVEGGMPGGVVGGIVGGIVSSAPLPPPPLPPPPQPMPPAPVRVGGQITAPAIVHRVEPKYPDLALAGHITGIVILEAQVDTQGCVVSVKVLRSRHPLVDDAAVEALKQWQYSPLLLNGVVTPFVLTVTFNFALGS